MATGPYDQFVGELWPTAWGWLPLDEFGTPIGQATLEPPASGFACAVQHVFDISGNSEMLATITGAPVTDRMVPNPDFRMTMQGVRGVVTNTPPLVYA
jgi:hypothetical protein